MASGQPRGAVIVQELRALRRLKLDVSLALLGGACLSWAGFRAGGGSPVSKDSGFCAATARAEAQIPEDKVWGGWISGRDEVQGPGNSQVSRYSSPNNFR